MNKKEKLRERIDTFQITNIYLLLGVAFGILGGIFGTYIYGIFKAHNLHHFIAWLSFILLVAITLEIIRLIKKSDKLYKKSKKKK